MEFYFLLYFNTIATFTTKSLGYLYSVNSGKYAFLKTNKLYTTFSLSELPETILFMEPTIKTAGSVYIKAPYDNYVLDVNPDSRNLLLYTFHGAAHQQFFFKRVEDNVYRIIVEGRCLYFDDQDNIIRSRNCDDKDNKDLFKFVTTDSFDKINKYKNSQNKKKIEDLYRKTKNYRTGEMGRKFNNNRMGEMERNFNNNRMDEIDNMPENLNISLPNPYFNLGCDDFLSN